MDLYFLLGRSGSGKSDYILDLIQEDLINDPFGSPIFYIVPEQMTFQQEYKLLKDMKVHGSIRAQVVSLSRLVWHVLQETGGGTRKFISSVGIQMALRKIVEERTSDWAMFHKSVDQQGFLEQLERLITEFKRYNISPEMIASYLKHMDEFQHQTTHEQSLQHKLKDLLYIYETLVATLQHTYIDAEDRLQLLIEKIPKATMFTDATIYVDGFHSFTPKELKVLETLIKNSKQTIISLTIDPNDAKDISELDLFYQTKNTYRNLRKMAQENNFAIKDITVLDPEERHFKDRPHIAHLEQHFNDQLAPKYEGEVPIKIAEAVHPRAEVEGVAQEIARLVREKNYRYRDLAIFVREPEVYNNLLMTIFADYNIPLFIDEKNPMLNHPLIECIRSMIEVVISNWRYEPVFRVLKTGLIPSVDQDYALTLDAIDELENYVLEYGIRSRSQWVTDEQWVFQRFRGFDEAKQMDWERETEERINAYRVQVAQTFEPFNQRLRKAKTVRDYCKAIYLFLESIQAPEQLEEWRTGYNEHGSPHQAKEQEQVWDAIIQLLDEMVEIAGDEEISLEVFRSSFEAGLETLEFSHVPPTLDHVIVGSIDHSRISGMKGVFLLGVNEGIWPMNPKVDGVISDQEREILAQHGLNLAESNERQLLDDWFYMYLALTSATDYLWVSYPLSNSEGETKMPSPIINQLKELYPSMEEPILLQDPDDLEDAERFIVDYISTLPALTAQLARMKRGYPIHPVWLHVLNWYIAYQPKNVREYRILQSLYYENKPTNLSKKTAQQLYEQKEVRTSVSRLETFQRCSFQHFAQYNLQLEERRKYKLDAPDIGQLFHESLKLITQWVQEQGKDFSDLSKSDVFKYADEALKKLAPILQHQILKSSNRYQYIQSKLRNVITRATFILREQAKVTKFSPVGIELGFGLGKDSPLSPLRIPLQDGYELLLRGRIDRVDQAQIDEQLYLRIIDYKSSKQGLNLLDVYYGLALQMLVYLDVILTQSEQWLGLRASPAGVLYFHVHDAMISHDDRLSSDRLEEALFKQYKMDGLVIAKEQIAQQMDTSLQYGHSDIAPFGLRKNGGFYSNSKVASNESFATLQSYVQQLITQAGMQMISGKIELNPFEHRQRKACRFCPFDAVCQFDPLLETNRFRKLNHLSDKEAMKRIEQEVKD